MRKDDAHSECNCALVPNISSGENHDLNDLTHGAFSELFKIGCYHWGYLLRF